ncbi:hypothetical protein BJX66DRAFT_315206 [Aspergillus keveii]|uniref:Uncharacterized protein n=1 Tax=Aspergillus keveii TaxID=714993 RepID=A0ABR4FQE7_9EURO
MARLHRDDFAQLHSVIPGLMLRVGQDQRCYNYLKWWAWVYKSEDPCDREIPWLCMKKANAFEDTKKIAARWSDLQQLVAFTVLKVKLLMDVKKLQNLTNWANANLEGQARLDVEKSKAKYVSSSIVLENRAILRSTDHTALIRKLTEQVRHLYRMIDRYNPHFWERLEQEPPVPDEDAREDKEWARRVFHGMQGYIGTIPGAVGFLKKIRAGVQQALQTR